MTLRSLVVTSYAKIDHSLRALTPLLLGLTDLVSEHGLPLGALAADVVVSRTNIFDSYIGKILCVRVGILFTSYPTTLPLVRKCNSFNLFLPVSPRFGRVLGNRSAIGKSCF